MNLCLTFTLFNYISTQRNKKTLIDGDPWAIQPLPTGKDQFCAPPKEGKNLLDGTHIYQMSVKFNCKSEFPQVTLKFKNIDDFDTRSIQK